MSKATSFGPSGTAVSELPSGIAQTISPLNFVADFSIVEEGPGKVIYTDVTAPINRPSTLRVARTTRPNVYAGTGISENVMAPSRKGSDIVFEIKEVWEVTESTDSTFIQHLPVRAAITLNIPNSEYVTAAAVERLVLRAVAALYEQADDDLALGLTPILHGVVKK